MTDRRNKREPNFTTLETKLLITLVKKYSSILESKKLDAVNNKAKEKTWEKLAKVFNSSSGIQERSSRALRAKYENLKKTSKRKYHEHRRSLSQDVLSLIQEEEDINELAGHSEEGLPADFDSDPTIIPDKPIKPEFQLIPEDKVDEMKDSTSENESSISLSRFQLKRKRCTPLRRNRNPETFVNTTTVHSILSRKKQQLLDAQIINIKQKTKQEAKEHELKCQLMELEIRLKLKELNK